MARVRILIKCCKKVKYAQQRGSRRVNEFLVCSKHLRILGMRSAATPRPLPKIIHSNVCKVFQVLNTLTSLGAGKCMSRCNQLSHPTTINDHPTHFTQIRFFTSCQEADDAVNAHLVKCSSNKYCHSDRTITSPTAIQRRQDGCSQIF